MKHVHGREGCQLLETENLIHVVIHNQMQDLAASLLQLASSYVLAFWLVELPIWIIYYFFFKELTDLPDIVYSMLHPVLP